jgi:formylglycine-generating enzyme required for sulfatase activity
VKKTIASLCAAICSLCLLAQHAAADFTAYQQTIPGSSLKFTMQPIPAGSFVLGSPATEKERNSDEGPQKKLLIPAFWMGAFEVSRDEFDVFYKDGTTPQNTADAVTRPSAQYVDLSWGMGKQGGFPVNSMSQYAALMYCRWLYTKTGIFYRLPSEAEWEYACRAGTATVYYFGENAADLDKYAWYAVNSANKFQKSGQKLPNAWGLYDMLGNVSEWTLDHYEEKAFDKLADNAADPGPAFSSSRYPKVVRGGGYQEEAWQLRVAHRGKSDPSWNKRDPQVPKSKWWLTEAASVGFRLVRPLKQPGKEEVEQFYKKYLGS